jgi:hypothetical protein
MARRIFETLKSRLPAGARADSRAAIEAAAAAVTAFKASADKIATDARYTAVGKRDALAELRKSTLEAGQLTDLRSTFTARLQNVRGEQANMRLSALGRLDVDPVEALRSEIKDGEVRSLLRSLTPGERLSALADPEIARAAASSTPLLSGIPPEVHVALVEKLTGEAVAAKFGDRAAQFAADAEEIEAVAGAIDVAVGLVERE